MKKLSSAVYLRIGIGVAVSGICLYLAIYKIDIGDVQQVMVRADKKLIILALFSVSINALAKILRWQTLFASSADGEVKLADLSLTFLSAQMLNAFLPLRIGEISRVVEIGKKSAGYAFVLGTIAIEKVLDMVAYALLFLALLLLIPLPEWMGGSGYAFVALTVLITTGILFITFQRDRLVRALERGVYSWPARVKSLISVHLLEGLSSLDVLRSQVDLVKLAFGSALIWGTAVLTNHLILLALDLHLPLQAPMLILIAVQAGVSIPALPGKIGIFEYICMLSLELFAIPHTISLSYGILLHAVVYLPIIISGLFSFWFLRLHNIDNTA